MKFISKHTPVALVSFFLLQTVDKINIAVRARLDCGVFRDTREILKKLCCVQGTPLLFCRRANAHFWKPLYSSSTRMKGTFERGFFLKFGPVWTEKASSDKIGKRYAKCGAYYAYLFLIAPRSLIIPLVRHS